MITRSTPFALFALALFAAPVAAQEVVLARVEDDGVVVLRQFIVPHMIGGSTPAPVKDGILPKSPERVRENQMKFKIDHLLVSTLDGKRVPAGEWTKQLKKETPVLYMGWTYISAKKPISKEEAERPGIVLPAVSQKVYRDGTLVVSGMRVPFEQNARTEAIADAPKGPAPEVVEASVTADGTLRLEQHHGGTYTVPIKASSADKSGVSPKAELKVKSTTINVRELPAEAAKLFSDGKQIPLVLKAPTPVLLTTNGADLDPFYLRLARPGTRVIAIPHVGHGAGVINPIEPKTADKPLSKADAHEIWKITTRGDEITVVKKYKFPGIQGAASAGMRFRGIQALNRLLEQIKDSKNAAETAAASERMHSIWKASVVDAQPPYSKFLDPMLDALEKKNTREFDRRANYINALILIQSAAQLGVRAEEISKMDTLAKQIENAESPADQKGLIEQMQKIYDGK